MTVAYFVNDERMKCVKQMKLYSRNVDIIYPEIEADLVAGSKLNNRELFRNVQMFIHCAGQCCKMAWCLPGINGFCVCHK